MKPLVAGAGLVLLAVAAVASLEATAASFTDRVDATGAVQAAVLPAPTGTQAAVGGDFAAVTVTWASGEGDFANGWEVFRHAGPCEGWTPAGEPYATLASATPTSYVDGDVQRGATYCYAVRSTFASWTSPFGALAEVTVPPLTTLFTHQASPNQLRATPGTGSHRYGCWLVVLLTVCSDDSYTFASTATYAIASNEGWGASLQLQGNVLLQIGSFNMHVDVWYTSAGCSSGPSSGTRIATGSTQVTPTPLVGSVAGTYHVPLAPAVDYVPPDSSQTVCTRITTTHPVVGLLSDFNLVNGANSWIEGPFGP